MHSGVRCWVILTLAFQAQGYKLSTTQDLVSGAQKAGAEGYSNSTPFFFGAFRQGSGALTTCDCPEGQLLVADALAGHGNTEICFQPQEMGEFGRGEAYERACTSGSEQPQCACFDQEPVGKQHPDKVAACLTAEESKAIYMFGDSHSHRLSMGLPHATTLPFKYYGSAALRNPVPEDQDDVVLEHLAKVLKQGDIVILARIMDYQDDGGVYKATLQRLLDLTSAKEAQLVVLYDNHWLPVAPQTCLLKNKPCAIQKEHALNAPRRKVLEKFMASNPSVKTFDILPVLCPGDTCNMYVPGTTTLAFIDADHLSEWAVLYIAKPFCEFFGTLASPSPPPAPSPPSKTSRAAASGWQLSMALIMLAGMAANIA